MSSDVLVWDNRATLTIPIQLMPATFDAAQAGRPTHTTISISTSELRALAAATAAAVELLDRQAATVAGPLPGGHS